MYQSIDTVDTPQSTLLYYYLLPIFFFNDPATTAIYTLSLHDALPISARPPPTRTRHPCPAPTRARRRFPPEDRKSTRLNSSHRCISYAVFCLKKKKFEIGWKISTE